LRRYGPFCDESLPYPVSTPRLGFNKEMTNGLHQCDSAFHSHRLDCKQSRSGLGRLKQANPNLM
jgi:hypothetical protein